MVEVRVYIMRVVVGSSQTNSPYSDTSRFNYLIGEIPSICCIHYLSSLCSSASAPSTANPTSTAHIDPITNNVSQSLSKRHTQGTILPLLHSHVPNRQPLLPALQAMAPLHPAHVPARQVRLASNTYPQSSSKLMTKFKRQN